MFQLYYKFLNSLLNRYVVCNNYCRLIRIKLIFQLENQPESSFKTGIKIYIFKNL